MIIIILLPLFTYCERTTTPKITPFYESIIHTSYETNFGQTLLLQYNSYPGIYDLILSKIVNGKLIQMNANTTLDPFTLQGCYPYERRLIQKEKFRLNFAEPNLYFTSMTLTSNNVFITRNDNSLYQFEINVDETNSNIIDFELRHIYNQTGQSDSHLIVCQDNICLIFADELIFLLKNGNYTILDNNTLRNKPKNIYYDQTLKTLYLCYGEDFVEVFLFSEGQLIHLKQIQSGSKIIQIKTNKEKTKLYLLDQEEGLIIHTIISISEYSLIPELTIKLINAQSFDFYQTTFFILALTMDQIPYVMEIFVNGDEYYFNKIYSRDMEIFDVYVSEHYAVLIGSETHKIIYHSIYNKFLTENEQTLYFTDVNLVDVEEYHLQNATAQDIGAFEQEPFNRAKIHYNQAFMIGLSYDEVSLFIIKSIPPWLQCQPTSENAEEYVLQMNATSCNIKSIENDKSQFKQCSIQHNFTLKGKQVLFYQEDKNYVIIISCVLVGLILFLVVTIILVKICLQRKIDRFRANIDSHIKFDEVDMQPLPGNNA